MNKIKKDEELIQVVEEFFKSRAIGYNENSDKYSIKGKATSKKNVLESLFFFTHVYLGKSTTKANLRRGLLAYTCNLTKNTTLGISNI